MQTKKIFFQVRILFTFFLMFFCSPVFSLNSYVDGGKFVVSLSSTYNDDTSAYGVNRCFDNDRSTICATKVNGYLEIDFAGDFDLTNIYIYNRTNCCTDSLAYFVINDSNDRIVNLNSDAIQSFTDGLDNVSNIKIYPPGAKLLNLSEVSFIFEPVASNENTNNPISEGVNWSLFAYSFTIVAVLFLFGRGIKTILDLVKYG